MTYTFQTEKMTVGYDGKPLIEQIDLHLEKGQILTLIGPNGSGKSTILKTISQQLALLGGTIYLKDQHLEQMSPSDISKCMSVVLTEKIKTEMMTCEDVVETGRYPYTGRFGRLSEEDHRIVLEAMELVHVLEIKDIDFTKISDGQRQRVMLARAICQEPEILILDEPTSYLDIKYKLEFLSILQDMAKKKQWIVILSLHELELAEKVSDKILCINGTGVECFGTPEEIFQPGYMSNLFQISVGSFDEINGLTELEPPKGEADIFVIAGGGKGRPVYRRLQRAGKAFITGILYDNDLDYPTAKALAQEVFISTAFEPVSEIQIEAAKKALEKCSTVICCKSHFGTYEQANAELFAYAYQCQKHVILERGEVTV